MQAQKNGLQGGGGGGGGAAAAALELPAGGSGREQLPQLPQRSTVLAFERTTPRQLHNEAGESSWPKSNLVLAQPLQALRRLRLDHGSLEAAGRASIASRAALAGF